jgi:hypothetical protein
MKGGSDWLRYRQTVLYPLLYPCAKQIHEATSQEVYVTENKASPHTKAKRLSVDSGVEFGCINVVEWPAKSPGAKFLGIHVISRLPVRVSTLQRGLQMPLVADTGG